MPYHILKYAAVLQLAILFSSCQKGDADVPDKVDESAPVEEMVYDETGLQYTAYTNLVMAGYQGWFAAEGDESNRGWYHYKQDCGFEPGCSTIDMWPDMAEYEKKYITPFSYSDGAPAYLYSPYDYESIDLHFKWMKEYGIDGVHMQRFLVEVKPTNQKGKRHFNKVLENALMAAKKYDRAISIMYDLSGSSSADMDLLINDWNELQALFKLYDNATNPTLLRHNGKPLLSIWGVGFNDNRKYNTEDVARLVSRLKGPENKVAIMLGVPYYWRTLGNDTEKSPELHELIKKVDIIMPWAVGRYNIGSYTSNNIYQDLKWTKANDIDYVPLVFPGFSWGNLKKNPADYNAIPREKGDFLWKQIAGAKIEGAESLYVAMFDEIDEGTAIFKVKNEDDVPMNANGKFIGIEEGLETDYYLWLTGQGGKWFHNDNSFSAQKPER